MPNRNVDVTIQGKNQASKAFREAAGEAEGFGARIGKLKGLFVGLGASIAAIGLGRFFKSSVEEAAAAEASWGRVESAVTNAGITFELVRGQLQGVFSDMQRTTRHDAEDVADAFTELLTTSNDYAGALDALSVTTDLAAAKQIDLRTAAQLVGRAMIGETGTLSRYGIIVEEGADAVEVMRERFQGFAEREAKTLQGQLAQVGNAWGDVKEAIGGAILGFDGAEYGTNRLTEALASLAKWIESNGHVFTDFADSMAHLASLYSKVASIRDIGVPHKFFDEIERTQARLNPNIVASNRRAAEGLRGEDSLAERNEIAAAREAGANRERVERERVARAYDEYLKSNRTAFGKEDSRTAKILGDVGTVAHARDRTPGDRPQIGMIGETLPELAPATEAMVQPLEAATEEITRMDLALGAVRDTLYDVATTGVGYFADTWTEAMTSIVTGSESAGQAILKAFRKATGMALQAEGQKWVWEAGAMAIKGFFNPIDWGRAAALLAQGTGAIAAGALIAGGGGGGYGGAGAGLSAGGFQQQQQEIQESRGTGTIRIVGGSLLDMSDPRQRDALADALNDLRNYRDIAIVVGG